MKKFLLSLLLSILIVGNIYAFNGATTMGVEGQPFEIDSSLNLLPTTTTPNLGSALRPMGDIYGGTLYVSGITLSGDMLLEDDVNLLFGTGSDYWQVYNSTGTQWELWSTDVDGGGTDGVVMSVDDGTDDVDFTGGATFGDNITTAGYIQGDSGGNTSVNIGTGTASAMTPTTNDLYITGQLEVDGITWFDGSVNFLGIGMRFYDNGEQQFGTGGDVRFDFSTAQTNDSLIMALDNTSRTFIITENNDRNVDFGHAAQSNPTFFVQSADATNPDQYISITHDQTNAVINTGSGRINFNADTESNADASWGGGWITDYDEGTTTNNSAEIYTSPVIAEGEFVNAEWKIVSAAGTSNESCMVVGHASLQRLTGGNIAQNGATTTDINICDSPVTWSLTLDTTNQEFNIVGDSTGVANAMRWKVFVTYSIVEQP